MVEDVDDTREELRDAIKGAFFSLAEEDGGLQTHMAASYVEWHMNVDHDQLDVVQQLAILRIVHQTVLKVLHADPSSLQMAHAHAYVHALAETYTEDDDDSDEEQPDTLLEDNAEDLEAWAAELEEYMREKKEEDSNGEEGPATKDE